MFGANYGQRQTEDEIYAKVGRQMVSGGHFPILPPRWIDDFKASIDRHTEAMNRLAAALEAKAVV